MNHINDFLLLQLDPKEKVKFSNTLIISLERFESLEIGLEKHTMGNV
jgi:hypothetical protein